MYTFTLPSGLEIELKEMTGAEEEILTNQRLLRTGDAINQVFKNCIVRLGDMEPNIKDILDLLSGDRLFILVKLRQISLGDEIDLEFTCGDPSCRASNHVTINLDEIEITPYTDEREFAIKLPSSSKVVHFVHLNGHMEKRLAALKEPTVSSVMLMRIIDVDSKSPSKKIMTEMSLRDRNVIRQEMQRVDAGPNTKIDVDCEACGSRITRRLEAEPDFLFPGAQS